MSHATSSVAERLQQLGSHSDLTTFAATFGEDWLAFFEQCPRADWLLAIAARLGAEPRALVSAAISCSREALTYLAEPDAELEAALDAAAAWTRADGNTDACREHGARLAARAGEHDAVVDSAVQAVVATLAAIEDTSAAAHAAACTTQTAVLAAGDCAMQSAMRFTQERCAGLARRELTPATLSTLAQTE